LRVVTKLICGELDADVFDGLAGAVGDLFDREAGGVEFGECVADGGGAVAAGVLEIEGMVAVKELRVVVDDVVGDVEGRGDLLVGVAGEEEGFDLLAPVDGVGLLTRGEFYFQFGGEGLAVGDIVLGVDVFGVGVDGAPTDLKVKSDGSKCFAGEEAGEDLLAALRWSAGGAGFVGALAEGGVDGG